MTWRNWSVIVIVILMNYIVFSLLGTLFFPPPQESGLIHTPQPTFTPGAGALTRVTLTYDFLTPTAAGTLLPATSGRPGTAATRSSTPTSSSSATLQAPTLIPTRR